MKYMLIIKNQNGETIREEVVDVIRYSKAENLAIKLCKECGGSIANGWHWHIKNVK